MEAAEPHVHNPRPFQCRMCSRSFMKNEHLVRHVRSHTKEKPFRCPDCGTRYSRRDTLIRHRRDVKCRVTEDGANDAAAHLPQLDHSRAEVNISDARSAISSISSPRELTPSRESTRAGNLLLHNTAHPPSLMAGSRHCDTVMNTPQSETRAVQSVTPSLGDTGLSDTSQDFVAQESTFPSGLYDFQECFPLWNMDTALHDDILNMGTSTVDSLWNTENGPESASTLGTSCSLQQIQRLWHSRIPDTPANELYYAGHAIEPIFGPVTQPRASLPDANDIDDQYRRGLENSLRISSREPVIPSVDFLNVCIRLYFTKVHPLFPIIHSATFRPSKSNAALLLSICAIGCLFTGSAHGFQRGVELFERNHKTILLKWERLTARSRDVMVSIIQSCLLSHLFGILSGSPVLLLTADAFHGVPVAWARHLRLHHMQSHMSVDLSSEGPELEDTWREWAHNEELLRIKHGLYIIDAELSSMTHREPYQSFESYRLSLGASEPAFMARNARDWKVKMLSAVNTSRDEFLVLTGSGSSLSSCFELDKVLVNSSFTANLVLQAIGVSALSERAKTSPNLSTLDMISESLTSFYNKFLVGNIDICYGHLQLPVLWHTTQMMVLADLDLLEKVVGRDGRCLTPAEETAFEKWISSGESRVCLKHALMIQRRMDDCKARCEPALHIPRALFWAGLVVSCHIRSKTFDDTDLSAHSTTSGLSHLGPTSSPEPGLSELHAAIIDSSSLKMAMFALADMLRTLGHWGLARRFADILTILTMN